MQLLPLLLLGAILAAAWPVSQAGHSNSQSAAGGCQIYHDIVSYSVTKSQTSQFGICVTDKLFQQTGQLMNIVLAMFQPEALSEQSPPSVLHFNATGFADFRGDKLVLAVASNDPERRIELRIEDPAAVRNIPIEIFHNLREPGGLELSTPLLPEQSRLVTLNRIVRPLTGLNDIRSELGKLRPAAYLGAILVIPFTIGVPEARFSRLPGCYPNPPHVDSVDDCLNRRNYAMLDPLLRHFYRQKVQPMPVQLFDSRGLMAQPFCQLKPSERGLVVALHFINGEPNVNLATVVVRLVGNNSTLVLLADRGAACPLRLRLRADESLLEAPTVASSSAPSLTIRHNCAPDAQIWVETGLSDALGGRVRIERVPELNLVTVRQSGRLLRHFMIQSQVMSDRNTEISFDVQFNQWAYKPMAALQTHKIVPNFTPDSALIYLDKSALNNCTHRLSNLSIGGSCPLFENATHFYRLLPTAAAGSDAKLACNLRRRGNGNNNNNKNNDYLGILTANVTIRDGTIAAQFPISLHFGWTQQPAVSKFGVVNRGLLDQARQASRSLSRQLTATAVDKFQFELKVHRLDNDVSGGGGGVLELVSKRQELLYSGQLLDCQLKLAGQCANVEEISVVVDGGCSKLGSSWLGPGVAVPLLKLPSNLADQQYRDCRQVIAQCRVAVCLLGGPLTAGLTAVQAAALGLAPCQPQGESCGKTNQWSAERNGSRAVLSPGKLVISLRSRPLTAQLQQQLFNRQTRQQKIDSVAASISNNSGKNFDRSSALGNQGNQSVESLTTTTRPPLAHRRVDLPDVNEQQSEPSDPSPRPPAYQLWSHLLASMLAFVFGVATTAAVWAIVSGWKHRARRRGRRLRRSDDFRECRCSSSSSGGVGGGGGGGCGGVGGGGGAARGHNNNGSAKSSADPLLHSGAVKLRQGEGEPGGRDGHDGNRGGGGGGGGGSCDSSSGVGDCGQGRGRPASAKV